ncbi:MAG: VWA domain-containing protein [Cyanobacteriota bacterium]
MNSNGKKVLSMFLASFLIFGCSMSKRAPVTSANESYQGYYSPTPADASSNTRPQATSAPMVPSVAQKNNLTQIDPPILSPRSSEEYSKLIENKFMDTIGQNALSTFSIDVDTASYSNIRRFLNTNQMPPKDSVRIEEMINYFSYDYPQPTDNTPFSINMETIKSPWKEGNKVVSIGLQGKRVAKENLPPSNIVFLIDTSGSMYDVNKLPLLKESFKLLVKELREEDRVSIVTYAGSAGVALESTSGANKNKIISALDQLQASGSTAGGQGINLAYKIAKDNFIKSGNNRVILATDGDFNVGVSSETDLVNLIEQKRNEGVFLSVLGFGMGNYKDGKMEKLADKGNGNYAYIDNFNEAKKVFVSQLTGTLLTIAKDVKIQVEFNPLKVKSYRLIGYENRSLANEDFNNDKKDAGELGAGHTVTALYEIETTGNSFVDPLKYQNSTQSTTVPNFKTSELMTVKLRYKEPKETESKLIVKTLDESQIESTSNAINFATSVAGFGMLLRNSEFKGNTNYFNIMEMAKKYKGQDLEGYRQEFIDLISKSSFTNN